eukprot:304982_1
MANNAAGGADKALTQMFKSLVESPQVQRAFTSGITTFLRSASGRHMLRSVQQAVVQGVIQEGVKAATGNATKGTTAASGGQSMFAKGGNEALKSFFSGNNEATSSSSSRSGTTTSSA